MDSYRAKQIVEERRSMRKVQAYCDRDNLPYPPELITYLRSLVDYQVTPASAPQVPQRPA
jgi:hypothetical protein